MKRLIAVVSVLFFSFQNISVKAQIDTCFWFAAPWVTPDHTWKDDVKLHLSTFNTATTVRLRQPGAIQPNSYDTTINIPANSTFDYVFWRDKIANSTNLAYDSLETRPANVVLPYGLYISSSDQITAVYDVITRAPSFLNPETCSLKGRNGLGTEFYCPFQTKWRNQNMSADLNADGSATQPKQQINIVATSSNTVVWITPKCNVVGHAANVSYSVALANPGDAYTVENVTQLTNVTGQSLSGTHITSDQPIAVTVNDDSVAGLTGCYDLMGDQLVPIDAIGTDYVLNKGYMNAPEFDGAYVVATQNNTQLTINDGVITTTIINQGATFYYKTTQPLTYINASSDVYCLHATGIGCELGEALLPPLNCAGSSLVAFSRNSPQSMYLNILCKNGSQSTFTLNNAAAAVNVPITAADFTVVPGTFTLAGGPYYGAQINVSAINLLPLGSYTIGNNTDVFALGIFQGGPATGVAFHYMSSFLQRTTLSTNTVAALCVSSTNTVALTGNVEGGSVSGLWSTPNGSGIFDVYTSTVLTVSTTYSLSNADTLLNSIKFYFTSVGNCSPIKDSVILQINQRPHVTVGNGMSMCKNVLVPIVLTGTVVNALGGTWSGGNGGVFGVGPNQTYTPSPADLVAGTISLSLTSQGALPECSNSVKTLTVSFLDPPVLIASPSVTAICQGQSAMLAVSGASSYTWTIPLAIAGASIIVSPTSTTVYQATGMGQNACSSSITATVTVNALPNVSISGSNSACYGSTVTLSANGAYAYSWSTNSTGSVVAVSPTITTLYNVNGMDVNGCGSSAVKTLSIIPLPLVSITSENMIICTGQSITLTANGAATYTWNTGVSGNVISVSPTVSSQYSVTGTGANGCIASSVLSQSVSECTGINKSVAIENNPVFLIYPNPSTGDLIIKTNAPVSDLILLNELGQVVKLFPSSVVVTDKLEVNGLLDGIYFIVAHFNATLVTEKIIVRR